MKKAYFPIRLWGSKVGYVVEYASNSEEAKHQVEERYEGVEASVLRIANMDTLVLMFEMDWVLPLDHDPYAFENFIKWRDDVGFTRMDEDFFTHTPRYMETTR